MQSSFTTFSSEGNNNILKWYWSLSLLLSYSYVMLGDTTCAAELRKLIAQCVSSDPRTYNAAFLGQDNSDYCNWILNKENWGGTCIVCSVLRPCYTKQSFFNVINCQVPSWKKSTTTLFLATLRVKFLHVTCLLHLAIIYDFIKMSPSESTFFTCRKFQDNNFKHWGAFHVANTICNQLETFINLLCFSVVLLHWSCKGKSLKYCGLLEWWLFFFMTLER